jgi:hypothetical protein
MNLIWFIQDLVEDFLDRLNGDQRWQLMEFLMRHGQDYCRVGAYEWAYLNDVCDMSFWEEIPRCNFCKGDAYCYCGKERA